MKAYFHWGETGHFIVQIAGTYWRLSMNAPDTWAARKPYRGLSKNLHEFEPRSTARLLARLPPDILAAEQARALLEDVDSPPPDA